MSLYDYNLSKRLAGESFYALIMAAMRKADSENMERLNALYPEVWTELEMRYNAPGGLLDGEHAYATTEEDDS